MISKAYEDDGQDGSADEGCPQVGKLDLVLIGNFFSLN